jgi:hypothetical protein
MASIIGTSSGTTASAARIVATSVSKSAQSTLAFVVKYRKKVRSLTPASAAICSMVVFSNPCSAKSVSAMPCSSCRLVDGGRPRRPPSAAVAR